MKILFCAAPAHGLMLPIIPLVWAARAAGHEVLLATTSDMADLGARTGLPVVDVFPDHNIWNDQMRRLSGGGDESDQDLSPAYRQALEAHNPFGMFALTMTEGSIRAGRDFGADLVVYTSDHVAGALTASALGVPALEAGNRVSWSMRDADFKARSSFVGDEILAALHETNDIPDGGPKLVARIDPRPPSMGGLPAGVPEEPDSEDGVPWWPMSFVPYNGGAVLPQWARTTPSRPRVCVTLGTVVPVLAGTDSLTAVIDALGGMDVEVVLATGEADLDSLGDLPDNVTPVGFVPLSAILPTCSLIVHHGGSGTTAAPMFYGVPQLVLPSFADNPMSAQRVADRGIGVQHDPSTVDAATLRDSIARLLTEPSFSVAAQEVAAEMSGQPSPADVMARTIRSLGGEA
ncbi:nucleotide disphospho-sugar-binding domain-containing protein [Spelaeicoccus albus]|uniref:UDP:flavonoid glycosyltransferase YjiC (YdhE family) n=1 Tax=Spelaeicoccus albus TaxID=1280376 RepID=A0A7Z0D1D9_9MICO|nr:nucleotide disphospho-sugar-binding domain-containing protein [Spelaeicoccus albus]NYI66848.1 UDP:flavonoid glycosyltransferase YjiC (YdhE family) [Spelaeicoccus albus]